MVSQTRGLTWREGFLEGALQLDQETILVATRNGAKPMWSAVVVKIAQRHGSNGIAYMIKISDC